MTLHIPDIRAIRSNVAFVNAQHRRAIPYANFMPSALITTLTVTNYAFGRMTRILTGYFLASPEYKPLVIWW